MKCQKCKKGEGKQFVMGMGMVCDKCFNKNYNKIQKLIKKFRQ